MIEIRVYGTPAPQGSKARGRHGGVYEMSKRVGPWRAAVTAATRQALEEARIYLPSGGFTSQPEVLELGRSEAKAVTVVFLMARPVSHWRRTRTINQLRADAPTRPATRPDLDKLVRSTLDGLKAGGAYGDDGQVTDLMAAKCYARPGDQPGAIIRIEPCKTEDY